MTTVASLVAPQKQAGDRMVPSTSHPKAKTNPAPPRFRTIANFGYFARAIKHMRFPSRTRESPHFPASTRPIVKHIFGTSRGDDGAELAAAEKSLMC
jgi:hypothetical protein